MLISQTHPQSLEYIISSYRSNSSRFPNFMVQATEFREVRDCSSEGPSSQVR